jgi:hypothetical protein
MTRKIKLGWSDKATDNFFYKGHSIYWNKGRTYIICPSGERYYVSSELSLEKVRESIDGGAETTAMQFHSFSYLSTIRSVFFAFSEANCAYNNSACDGKK